MGEEGGRRVGEGAYELIRESGQSGRVGEWGSSGEGRW